MKKLYSTLGLLACAAIVATLALLVAPGLSGAQSSAQEVKINLSEFQFNPSDVHVTQGQTVRFVATNSGKFPHNIAFKKDDKNLTVFAEPIKGGQSGDAEFTFQEAGTWQMYCPVGKHADQGMVGQALVLAAGSSPLPTTGQPADQPLLIALFGMVLLAGGFMARRFRLRRSL